VTAVVTGGDCADLASLLAPYATGHLAGQEAARVAAHVAGCDACRATVAALALAAGVEAAPARSLWPRLNARLAQADAEARVALRPPRLSWAAAAALAILVVSPFLTGAPLRYLALVVGTV
jgi:predicted anti-sigma-YlaC factor YlaD